MRGDSVGKWRNCIERRDEDGCGWGIEQVQGEREGGMMVPLDRHKLSRGRPRPAARSGGMLRPACAVGAVPPTRRSGRMGSFDAYAVEDSSFTVVSDDVAISPFSAFSPIGENDISSNIDQ